MEKNEVIEAAARKLAAAHYAGRFNLPEDDQHVLTNVEANWYIFAAEVRVVMNAIALAAEGTA